MTNDALTIQAINNCGQNTIGIRADDGELSSTGSYYWDAFLTHLEATKDTAIKTIAVIRERALQGSGIINRWGVVGGSKGDTVTRSSDAVATAGWVAAATELSNLSIVYPNLIGFTIDDFGPVGDAYYDGYSLAQISSITAAGNIINANFKFLPTHYYQRILKNVIPGFMIGSTYGQAMNAGEYVACDYSFDIVGSVPSSAVLSFLNFDNNEEDSDYSDRIRKKLFVNGNLIFDESVRLNNFIEKFSESIVSNLLVGQNIIRFEIVPTSDTNEYHRKVWYISSPELVLDDIDISDSLTQTFDYLLTYANAPDIVTYPGAKVIHKTNADGLYMNSVDGVFAVYSIGYPSMAAELAQEYKNNGTNTLIHVQQGFLFLQDIVGSEIVNKFTSVRNIADGLMVWNYPLGLDTTTEGIFANRLSNNVNYPIVAVYPSKQPGLRGFYQKWTTNDQYTGNITFNIKDNKNIGGSKDYFIKKVLTSSGTVLYNASIVSDDNAVYTQTVDVGQNPVNIIFEFIETDSVGDYYVEVYFNLNAGGNDLVNSDFSYEGSVSEQAVQELFDNVKTYFINQ
jgi:hypothetical protein